ncbi:hypothetical protein LO772_18745 [Yinghuangia sp. ASG 101]|uniref:hypothetical protein n=1 Tax=Yinghuangia sp. ASG 101 TaxID=2896848 RepID=UPI001E44834D|nr:hypothetical protein [Yinghuangia sp. ASG 101]UGQ09010.1 hypothetical protein LO772_18745 [Yinghuangia sp. ASG 101]
MSIPYGGGYPPGPPNVPPNVPGPPGGGWNTPPPGGPVPPSGPLPPGGPPSGSWPPHGYPYGPPPPPGGGRRNAIIAAVVGTVVVIAGVIVAIVLITGGDDDKGNSADPSDSVSGTSTVSQSASASTSASASSSASVSPSASPTTRQPTTSAPPAGTTVLGDLREGDCIAMPEMTFVTRPIPPVPCGGSEAHWKIVGFFTDADESDCEALAPERGYVGHLKEFSSAGRVACLGFTRNTTLDDMKGLAGAAAANMTQADFDAMKKSYEDRGYKIE